jgi:hypothetical protein
LIATGWRGLSLNPVRSFVTLICGGTKRASAAKMAPKTVLAASYSHGVTKAGNTVAYVLPITHTPPLTDEHGIEIPQATKRRLGLDAERSWIVTTELNQFMWPGPDIRPTASGEYVYGYLPEKLMRLVLEQVKKHAREKQLKAVTRTE